MRYLGRRIVTNNHQLFEILDCISNLFCVPIDHSLIMQGIPVSFRRNGRVTPIREARRNGRKTPIREVDMFGTGTDEPIRFTRVYRHYVGDGRRDNGRPPRKSKL